MENVDAPQDVISSPENKKPNFFKAKFLEISKDAKGKETITLREGVFDPLEADLAMVLGAQGTNVKESGLVEPSKAGKIREFAGRNMKRLKDRRKAEVGDVSEDDIMVVYVGGDTNKGYPSEAELMDSLAERHKIFDKKSKERKKVNSRVVGTKTTDTGNNLVSVAEELNTIDQFEEKIANGKKPVIVLISNDFHMDRIGIMMKDYFKNLKNENFSSFKENYQIVLASAEDILPEVNSRFLKPVEEYKKTDEWEDYEKTERLWHNLIRVVGPRMFSILSNVSSKTRRL